MLAAPVGFWHLHIFWCELASAVYQAGLPSDYYGGEDAQVQKACMVPLRLGFWVDARHLASFVSSFIAWWSIVAGPRIHLAKVGVLCRYPSALYALLIAATAGRKPV